MIIIRTPFRISLFGGGTDIKQFYENHPAGGAVIGFALDKYCWITLRRLPPFFDYRHRIVYSKVEQIQNMSEVQHPVIRCILGDIETSDSGFELHHDGDLPARAGLGSSSSFTVGLLNAVDILCGHYPYERDLVNLAYWVERDILKEPGGIQDQVWAAFGGGPSRINFRSSGFSYRALAMSQDRISELLSYLMLVFTGFQRDATTIETAKISSFSESNDHMLDIRGSVDDAEYLLTTGQIKDIGPLLATSWASKKALAPGVTTSEVDVIYDRALDAGATGGKLCGAGGGGFMLLFVPPEKKNPVRSALTGLVEVPIGISPDGSKTIVNDSN